MDKASTETRRKGKRRKAQHNEAYVMILPAIVVVSVFVVAPLLYSSVISFFRWSFYGLSEFVGLRNYMRVLNDRRFFLSFRNVFLFMAIILPVQVLLAFFYAHVLKNLRGHIASFAKTSVYIPNVISGIIASVIFMFIYSYDGGLLNFIVGLFGGDRVAWLVELRFVRFSVAVPIIWLGFGFVSLLLLAGLNDIPSTYYEVADLDGARAFHKLFFITVPLMKNVFAYVVITSIIFLTQMFEVPYMMTGGGPQDRTLVPIVLIFQHFTADARMDYTIAASLLVFVVLSMISAVVFRLISSEKVMDG